MRLGVSGQALVMLGFSLRTQSQEIPYPRPGESTEYQGHMGYGCGVQGHTGGGWVWVRGVGSCCVMVEPGISVPFSAPGTIQVFETGELHVNPERRI